MNNRKKGWRKEKWKNTPLSPSNIDEYLQDLYDDTNGQYVTQGVSFNKDDGFQMNLLKQALLEHGTFSGLIKHLLHSYFTQKQNQQMFMQQQQQQQNIIPINQHIAYQQQSNQQNYWTPKERSEQIRSEVVEEQTSNVPETPNSNAIKKEEKTNSNDSDKSKGKGESKKGSNVKVNISGKPDSKKSSIQSFIKPNPNAKKPSEN